MHRKTTTSRSRRTVAPRRDRSKQSPIPAAELDRLHDAGEDLSAHMDLSTARRPGLAIRRVNVDFPEWMIQRLDGEARRLGVTRQSVIKVFIAEQLRAARASG